MKKNIIILCLQLIPILVWCQGIVSKGKVSDPDQVPLKGVTVLDIRTSKAVYTNTSGEYEIELSFASDTLLITLSGYTDIKITNDGTNRQIILYPKVSILGEVVLNTGYESIFRERVTGAFENIGNKQLNMQVSTNILERLEGISSLYVDHNSLRPPLLLRGPSSIMGDKAPLVVVDNFPYEGDIANINPNEVESITILKDAAASSVWGARAGNGVIVITTKKGRFHQPLTIETNNSISISERPNLEYLQSVNATDFIDSEIFLFSNKFRFSDTSNVYRPAFSPVYEILFQKQNGTITDSEADRQLQLLSTRSLDQEVGSKLFTPAISRQFSLGMRGGSQQVNYYFAVGFNQDEDALKAINRRLNLRSELVFKPVDKLQLNTGIIYTHSSFHSGKPGFNVLRPNLYPYSQLSDEAGNPFPLTVNIRAPYADTAGGGKLLDWHYFPLEDYRHQKLQSKIYDMVVNAGLRYQLIPEVVLDLKYQYERQQTTNEQFFGQQSYYTRNLINLFTQFNRSTGVIKYPIPLGSIVDNANEVMEAQHFRAQISMEKKWGYHRFNAIAGNELRLASTNNHSNRVYGFSEDILTTGVVDYVNPIPTFITGAQDYIPQNVSFSAISNRFISLYANAAYSYKMRYVISGSARRDASNLYGVKTNDKWQPLWSAGVSWQLSSEPFFKQNIFTLLRAKITYGYSGNTDQSRSAVTTLAYVGVPASNTNFTYANIRQLANPELRWEKSGMLNLGFDFETFNSRLNGTLSYYLKNGTDLFGSAPVDYTAAPANTLFINIANMRGSGLEMQLNALMVNRSFKWRSTLLFNYQKSKVTKYYNTSNRGRDFVNNGSKITALEGRSLYSVISFQWAGLDSTGNPTGIVNREMSNDYALLTGSVTQINDLVYDGPAIPPIFGSLNNNISWKGFSMEASLLFKFGHYFRKESINYDILFRQHQGHNDLSKRWQNSGDENNTNVPSMIYPNNSNRDFFYTNSSVLVRKGDNIRLHYINISYDLALRKTKLPFNQLKIYLVGSNLGILWRANKDHIDPDYGLSMPAGKTFSIGMNAIF